MSDNTKDIENRFKTLDEINKTLSTMDEIVSKKLKTIRDSGQEQVDKICVEINNTINPILAEKRQILVDILQEQYQANMVMIEVLKPLIDVLQLDFNIDTIVSAVKKLFICLLKIYLGPYQNAITYVTELAPRLLELTENILALQDLMYKIEVPEDINLDKLNITMEPINIKDITG